MSYRRASSASDAGSASVERTPTLLLRGLDSLYVSFYLDTGSGLIDWDDLGFRKERVGRERGRSIAEITLGTETFALKPFGKHPYRFILSNRAFEVRLGENMSPSCHVQFASEGLWTEGASGMMARFYDWAASMRLDQIKPEVVSRADYAFDYHLPVADFDTESFVSRAKKDGHWRENGAYQSFQIGVGDVVVRVYDKVAEISQASEKTWFYQLWDRTDEVWRVEFQVRDARLKQAGIRTFADLQGYQADLLRELATGHTTLRRPTADPNRSRWPLHPLWQALQAQIATMPQTGLAAAIDEAAALDWRLHRNLKSLLGYLKNIAALDAAKKGQDEAASFEAFMAALPQMLTRHNDEHVWKTDTALKIQKVRLGQ